MSHNHRQCGTHFLIDTLVLIMFGHFQQQAGSFDLVLKKTLGFQDQKTPTPTIGKTDVFLADQLESISRHRLIKL